MSKINEFEKAWLAGFIDGEGYIGITFQRKKQTSTSSASPLYHPFLIIVNTNKDVLLYIKQLIGGGKLYILRKKNSHNNKKCYQFKLTKMDRLLRLLEEIDPYLKIKNKQCEFLIAFLKRRMYIKPITGRGSRGITSFTDEDKEIYDNLLSLNKRGIQI